MYDFRSLKACTHVAVLSLTGLTCPAAFARQGEKTQGGSFLEQVVENRNLALQEIRQGYADLNRTCDQLGVPTDSLNDRETRCSAWPFFILLVVATGAAFSTYGIGYSSGVKAAGKTDPKYYTGGKGQQEASRG